MSYTCRTCGKPITVAGILVLDRTPHWGAPWVHLYLEDRTGDHQAKPVEIDEPR